MFITQTESLERCKQINWAAKKKRARSREWCHCVMFGFRDGNKEFEFEFRARIRDRDRGKYAQSGVSNLFLSFSPINPSRRHTLTSIWGWYGSVINPVKDLIFFYGFMFDLFCFYFYFSRSARKGVRLSTKRRRELQLEERKNIEKFKIGNNKQ